MAMELVWMAAQQCYLSCFGRPVRSVLHLLDRNENGLTYALGYAIQQSVPLSREFLRLLGCHHTRPSHLQLSLQERSEEGITDLELHGGHVHVVVEAKKCGWPQQRQMEQYEAKLLDLEGQRVLCALGAPPICLSPVRDWRPKTGVVLRHLRWLDVLESLRRTQRLDSNPVLADLASLIRETIAMQSYDREVLVRDMRWGTESTELFFDGNIYICQPSERTEPLFFAPCFTNAPARVHNGIHYFSRVYYRTAFPRRDRKAAKQALAEASAAIIAKANMIRKRKTAKDEVRYLESLPETWERGLRMLHKPGDQHAVFFLGTPIPLPRPVYKKGRMIPVGFSMSLEQLMKGNDAVFNC